MILAVNCAKALLVPCLVCGALVGSTCAAAEPDPNGTWKFTLVFQAEGSGEFDLDVWHSQPPRGGWYAFHLAVKDPARREQLQAAPSYHR